MYKYLEAELIINGITKEKLASMTNMKYQTLLTKLRGEREFSLFEAFRICVALKTDKNLEELFNLKELIKSA